LLSNVEKGIFLRLYNRSGYVLDFCRADLDVFTMQSIGVPVCEKYQLSMGQSLTKCVYESSETDSQELLLDLLEYYEAHFEREYVSDEDDPFSSYGYDEEKRSLYVKCRKIADREKAAETPLKATADYLKQEFDSEHLNEQIDLLMKMRTTHPFDAIGKSKDLIESCCKTILEAQGIEWNKDWNVAQLAKRTAKVLGIDGNEVDSSSDADKLVKQILGSLQGIASGVAEFRNQFGSGHGKSATFQEPPVRHAKLAVGASVTLVEYYWETYEWRKKQGRLK
jgi:hypothetical protein